MGFFIVAKRVGFEPTVRVNTHTLSKHLPTISSNASIIPEYVPIIIFIRTLPMKNHTKAE